MKRQKQTLKSKKQSSSAEIWAIYQPVLDEALSQITAGHHDGESEYTNDDRLEINSDGIAIIRILGPMMRGASLFDMLIGGVCDLDQIAKDVLSADQNDSVKGIFYHVDSPGGGVPGTKEFSDLVSSISKPSITFTDGVLTSGAYWAISGTDRIVATETSKIGSIGIIGMHLETSKMDEEIGIKRTYIYNGKFKAIANNAEPLSEEAEAYLQGTVDSTYDIFVNDVATNRGKKPDKIRGQESRIYLAKEAKTQGLIDGVGNFDAAYNTLRRRIGIMDKAEFKSQFSALHSEVLTDGVIGASSGDIETHHADKVSGWIGKGKEEERARISDIQESAFEGQGDLVATLIKDGTSADDARKQLITAQKAKTAGDLKTIADGDIGDLGAGSGEDEGSTVLTAKDQGDAGNQLDAIAKGVMKADSVEYDKAFSKALADNPKLAEIYQPKIERKV